MDNLETVIRSKLRALGNTTTETGNDFILTECLNPAHTDAKPSFSVNLVSGSCVCFTCQYRLDSEFWTDGIQDDEQLEELEREGLYSKIFKSAERNAGVEVINTRPPDSGVEIKDFRGLTDETISRFGLYKCEAGKYKGRIIFPINQSHFESRSLQDLPNKYMHSFGFSPKTFVYPEQYIDSATYLVIVEGIIDCISLHQDGINSACNFGASGNLLSNKNISTMIKAGIETIYLMFDDDEAGKTAELLFINNELLNEYFEVKLANKLKILEDFYNNEYKDYNEYITNTR